MSYFNCPKCGERSEIFGHGGAKDRAREMGIDFLGEVDCFLYLSFSIHYLLNFCSV